MTEVISNNSDWEPDRKRRKPNENDFIQEQMEIDVNYWFGEHLIEEIEEMIVDDEFVERYFRQAEGMEIAVGSNSILLDRPGSRQCYCCRKNFKKICRKRKWQND